MSMGAFAMILLENALLPDEALVSDELKLVLALVAGAALWFVTTQAEHLIVQIFGAAAGMAAGSLVYNVAAHLALVAPEYLVAMLAVGGLVGYAGAGYMKSGAYIVLYSIAGGFLVMSAMSYFMWKHMRVSDGDLWLTHIASPARGIDPSDGTNVACFFVWLVCACAGIAVQNSMCEPEGRGRSGDKKGTDVESGEGAYGSLK